MTSPKPLVSVLIPCHNYGRFLGQAIESIIKQSLENWECIIVDDGSSDNTSHVADYYVRVNSRIRYLKQDNDGVSAARNAALLASQGEFVQFLDADDKIQPDKLKSHATYLLSHPDVDLVYGDVDYFYEADGKLATDVVNRLRFPNISASGSHLLPYLIRRNIMVINSPLVRRSCIDEVGYFNIDLHGHEDWEYWIRLAIIGKKFHYMKSHDANALVRIHSQSAVQKQARMLLNNLKIRQELDHLALDPSLRRINRRGIGFQFVKLAKLEARERNIIGALRYAIKAILVAHGSPSVLLALLIPLSLSTRLAIIADRLAH